MTAAPRPQTHRFGSLPEASRALADFIVESCLEEIDHKGYFTLVLSGGATPGALYEMLGAPPYAARIPWHDTYLFWGDERCVPKEHEHSNYRMINTLLLAKVGVPSDNIFPMPGELEDPAAAAELYERMIADFFAAKGVDLEPGEELPEFDFLLQGMGNDGHTASLFPGDAVLLENEKWVAGVRKSPTAPVLPRITLTLPVINNGKRVVFLVSGKEKLRLLDEILNNHDESRRKYPAAMVDPNGHLYWYAVE